MPKNFRRVHSWNASKHLDDASDDCWCLKRTVQLYCNQQIFRNIPDTKQDDSWGSSIIVQPNTWCQFHCLPHTLLGRIHTFIVWGYWLDARRRDVLTWEASDGKTLQSSSYQHVSESGVTTRLETSEITLHGQHLVPCVELCTDFCSNWDL